jgi:hypothetical protein
MIRAFARLFQKKVAPVAPFTDPELGEFRFVDDLGWKGELRLGAEKAELILGSDGENPSEEMVRTARSWLAQWQAQRPRIIDYIRSELDSWSDEPNLPRPSEFEVESINILWREKPDTSMIYFRHPGDDIRAWHVTFHGFDPHGLAYDD